MDRPMVVTAAAAAALHLAAGGLGVWAMPGATPAMQPDAGMRAAYLDDHAAAWRLAWLAWALSGLSFAAVMIRLAPAAAVWGLAVVAVASDLASQFLLAWVVPDASPDAQGVWEHIGWTGATMVANLAYTALGVVAVLRARRRRRIAALTAWLSAPVWLAGVLVAAAHAAGWDLVLVVATGALTAAVTAWLAWLGVQAWRS